MNRLGAALAMSVAGLAGPAVGGIINVGSGDSIQAAIDAAMDGDEIVVAPGVYDTELIDFVGKAITVRSSGGAAVTTIARPAGVGGTVVLFDSGEGPESVLEGFTVTGGDLGCDIGASSPTVKSCVFTLLMTIGVDVTGQSSPMIADCSFIANAGQSAIQVQGNSAAPTIANCMFVNNASASGGAVRAVNGTTTIINSTFNGNHASCEGGAIFISANAVIKNSIFTNNTADFGGAIYTSADSTFVNCLIVGNEAVFGGGIFSPVGFNTPLLVNCTIAQNVAGVGGGVLIDAFTVLTIHNSIVWGNTPEQIVADDLAIAEVRYSNVEGGGWPGPGNDASDPLFVDTANGDFHLRSGSPSIDAGHNWALPTDSTDLDGDADTTELLPLDLDGNPRFADDVATTDTGCGATAIVDMGAYEFPGTALACLRPGDVNGDGTVNVLDLIDLLLAFGASCEDVCCLADFNIDGSVNVLDLIDLLLAFGTACP